MNHGENRNKDIMSGTRKDFRNFCLSKIVFKNRKAKNTNSKTIKRLLTRHRMENTIVAKYKDLRLSVIVYLQKRYSVSERKKTVVTSIKME
jgi:hypothetical protein